MWSKSTRVIPPRNSPSSTRTTRLPTLVDRDLVLYESKVMMEYLDERFPHPPLLPVYPVARAESRLFIHRIEKDWCALVDQIQNTRSDNVVEKCTKELREGLLAIAPDLRREAVFHERRVHAGGLLPGAGPLAAAYPGHRVPGQQAEQAAAGLHGPVQPRCLPGQPVGAGAGDAPLRAQGRRSVMTMSSSRPYVMRALYEWILDNDCTPYVLVNAEEVASTYRSST